MNEPMSIWMEDENGNEIEFEVIGTFVVDDLYYMALFRVGNPDTSEAELIGFHEGPDGNVVFDPITDDLLYQRVADAFQEGFNAQQDEASVPAPEPAPVQEEVPEEEEALEEEDFCYEDEDGRLFIFGAGGEKIYLDENGNPIQ